MVSTKIELFELYIILRKVTIQSVKGKRATQRGEPTTTTTTTTATTILHCLYYRSVVCLCAFVRLCECRVAVRLAWS